LKSEALDATTWNVGRAGRILGHVRERPYNTMRSNASGVMFDLGAEIARLLPRGSMIAPTPQSCKVRDAARTTYIDNGSAKGNPPTRGT
jgi:hypothetical protein